VINLYAETSEERLIKSSRKKFVFSSKRSRKAKMRGKYVNILVAALIDVFFLIITSKIRKDATLINGREKFCLSLSKF
jgi:hypothetical protein